MNGTEYICVGCERRGAVPVGQGWYECPVCRIRWELPGGRSKHEIRQVITGRPWYWKKVWADRRNAEVQRAERAEQRQKRKRPPLSAREKWKRWHRMNRYLYKRAMEHRAKSEAEAQDS